MPSARGSKLQPQRIGEGVSREASLKVKLHVRIPKALAAALGSSQAETIHVMPNTIIAKDSTTLTHQKSADTREKRDSDSKRRESELMDLREQRVKFQEGLTEFIAKENELLRQTVKEKTEEVSQLEAELAQASRIHRQQVSEINKAHQKVTEGLRESLRIHETQRAGLKRKFVEFLNENGITVEDILGETMPTKITNPASGHPSTLRNIRAKSTSQDSIETPTKPVLSKTKSPIMGSAGSPWVIEEEETDNATEYMGETITVRVFPKPEPASPIMPSRVTRNSGGRGTELPKTTHDSENGTENDSESGTESDNESETDDGESNFTGSDDSQDSDWDPRLDRVVQRIDGYEGI